MAGKRRRALRSRMKRIPEGDMIAHILGVGGPALKGATHDRTAAIGATNFLEFALRKAICLHFAPDPRDANFNYLFENDEAPYREFAARTRLARALGIITFEQFEQLEAIRHIRNAFAHTMDMIDFDVPEVAALCAGLTSEKLIPSADFPVNRQAFVIAVINFYLLLTNYSKDHLGDTPSST